MKFKIRYADQIVGFFSLLALALLVVFVFLIGAKQNWFAKKNTYYAYFTSGAGFSVGMDVSYKGFPIGKINDVKLEGSSARVEFYILADYSEYVKENSLVELITSPIGLGSSFIFHPGRGPGLLPSGSEIYRIDSIAARELISEKKIRIEIQEDSIGVLMKKVSMIMDNVNILLFNLNGAISGESENSTPINKIVSGITEITHNISVLTDTLNSQDGAVPALLGRELTTDVSDVLKNISIVSEELTSITGNADQIVDTALPEVDAILVQLNSMLLDVQDVLEGVKNNPLIRGGVPDRTRGKSSINQLRSEDF
ncbi:MAG: MCE family protein [Treponema sp.]|uniref:MlaD family protein n=1 Tax=Treponema sp. TaxID=166 RepID=UPI0025D6C6B9|nr:MlaD family protein [Treponema sp.]MBQ9281520.1 MCE family protein [Treponema sp.]